MNLKEKILKNKIIIILSVCLIVAIIFILFIFLQKNSNEVQYTTGEYIEDEDADAEKEKIQSIINNIKVEYDDIIYDKYGSDYGAVKVKEYQIVPNIYGSYSIYWTFEKVKETKIEKYDSFAIWLYYYDELNNFLFKEQAFYIAHFGESEIGTIYHDTSNAYKQFYDKVATIKLIGGQVK